jgi:cell wall-associated NlpC family hydrolase
MAVLATSVALSATAVIYFAKGAETPAAQAVLMPMQGSPTSAPPTGIGYRFERLSNPDRTVVRDGANALVATLTDGARTVVLTGPARTFSDPKFTDATVTSQAWVRLAPEAWREGAQNAPWFTGWLLAAVQDRSPDALAIAMQYLDGAPDLVDAKGLRIGGDASFGPVRAADEAPLERSDFYDYLGIPWNFPGGLHQEPTADRKSAVDCSGFVRLVYGYRMGYPLIGTNTAGPGLPRRAYGIADFGPGALLVPNTKQTAVDYQVLQPGDLLFFEIDSSNGDQLDHTGIYLGVDSNGHHRFVSSRQRANGPTSGDLGGTSLLDDGGHYSDGFRAARRI